MTGNEAPLPDLEMRVRKTFEGNKTRLSYVLNSPRYISLNHYEIRGPALQGSPDDLHSRVLQKLQAFTGGNDEDGSLLLYEDIGHRLSNLGRQLWEELFPPELKTIYLDIRKLVKTWLIISDDPSIPWEIIKPYDDSRPEEIIDDDFLGFNFELTRWDLSSPPPPVTLHLRKIALIASSHSYPSAAEEEALISGLTSISPSTVEYQKIYHRSDLISCLTSGVDLLHAPDSPTSSDKEVGILLEDGFVLRPEDLYGPVQTLSRQRRPFIFLNGGAGVEHLRAKHWIRRLGAGAFISPSWPIRDSRAYMFAHSFYESLINGETFGRAGLIARLRLREAYPQDFLSGLAYTIYSHPNVRLNVGAIEPTLEPPASETYVEAPAVTPKTSVGQLPGAISDRIADRDQLGFNNYIEAFVELIQSAHTQLPLTVGILGSWGMGKSFLLEHIRIRVEGSQRTINSGSLRSWLTTRMSLERRAIYKTLARVFRRGTKRHKPTSNETRIHVITFNAWEYSASEAIWPGLVRKIMNRLEREIVWPWPGRFFLKLSRNIRDSLKNERGRILIISYLTAALAAAMIFLVGTGEEIPQIWKALLTAGALGGIFKLVTDTLANPLSQWITNAFKMGDYGRHIGHLAQIRGDLEFLERELSEDGGRALVLIDDLDRCEPEKAVEMLQAIKLLLDFETFIIFLGIDARIITRAIERHYQGLLGEAGASGYEYLDKIVQIPFRIPTPGSSDVANFLSELLGNPSPPTYSSPKLDIEQESGAADSAVPSSSFSRKKPGEIVAEVPMPGHDTLHLNKDLQGFSYDELRSFQNLVRFLEPNPRHLKRLINVYRLVRTLIMRSEPAGLLNRPGATICWVVLCAQWPYSAHRMLGRFEELEAMQREQENASFPHEPPLQYLFKACCTGTVPLHQKLLDRDLTLLARFVAETEEARMSWEELRLIRRYTINFNPAVEVDEVTNSMANGSSETIT